MKRFFRNQTPQQFAFAMKLLVSGVCLLILLFLYTLGNRSIATMLQDWKDHLPSLPQISFTLPAKSDTSTPPETSTPVSDTADTPAPETVSASISFDQETLVYDGSEPLDLTGDVHVLDASGTELQDVKLSTDIAKGDSKDEKQVTYTATVDGTEVSATRVLKLEDYDAPSIQVDEDALEGLTSDNLDTILEEWIASGALQAEDGLGGDCSDDITETHEQDPEDILTYHYTFSVTNQLGDRATETAEVQLTMTKPLILLTTDEVTLQVGEEFNYNDYIQTCIDADGESLADHIILSNRPDTDEPGTYEVEYVIYDYEGVYSDPAVLKVIVEASEEDDE